LNTERKSGSQSSIRYYVLQILMKEFGIWKREAYYTDEGNTMTDHEGNIAAISE